jgi:hypothetical protein
MKLLLITLSLIFMTGCASRTKNGAEIGSRLDERTYNDLIMRNTRHDIQYDGFYNKFEIYATFLNTQTQAAILQKNSDVYQWDTAEAQRQREKVFQENSTETRFAVSFFVPSVRLNDLHKGASIWKIYLEANGQRYEGKASRRNGKLEDIQASFPYHNRWSVPYEVVFKVPLTAVEQGTVRFILTSSQGTSKFEY